MAKLLLIDGNSIMNRGFFALPPTLTNSEGFHTNAILGFLNIFFKVYDEEKPDHIIVAFDLHEPTFRHKMYAEYKGKRNPMPEELKEQFPVIKDILHAMHIKTMEKAGFEADDLIGSASRYAVASDMDVTVLSGDRDLLQLATDRILIRIPKTKQGQTLVENYYEKDVIDTYGVNPTEFIEMKGLMGDQSDNIPGVQGFGPKTAEKIIKEFHTIENAIENYEAIKPAKTGQKLYDNREIAIFSRDLSRIKLDCELGFDVKDSKVSLDELQGEEAFKIFTELELRSILKRFDDKSMGTSFEPEIVMASSKEIVAACVKNKKAGIFPAKSEDDILGLAFSIAGKIYLTDNIGEYEIRKIYRELADKKVSLSLISIKDFIDKLDIREEDDTFDCALGAYLIDPLKGGYDYTYLAQNYLSLMLKDEKDLIGKLDINIFSFQEESFKTYLAYNAYTAEKCADIIKEKLNELDMYKLYSDMEHPLTFILHDMEKEGIAVSKKELEDYGARLSKRIDELTVSITEYAGEKFNINSTKQLGVILFEKLGLQAGKKTKSGYSTSVEVLEKIKDQHPIIKDILEYRQLSKLKSTYVDGLIQEIKSDNRIHSKFQQTVTATGRISSTEPNLQNIPMRSELGREIRKAFIPKDGCVFIDADYSQIELRIMAAMSEDENLINAFYESKDIHAITASKVFNVPLDEVTSDLRRKAKAVNFGIIYGISSFGLGQDLDIGRKEAQEYIDKYFLSYQKVKSFLDKTVEDAKEKGYVKTLFNRIRPIPELKSSNFMQRSFGERVAMNSPIQGTAADIMKIAMINVSRKLSEMGLKSKLILQIHDELLIEAPIEEKDIASKILVEEMEHAVSLRVAIYADMHVGNDLFDVK